MSWLIFPIVLVIIGLVFDIWFSFFSPFEWFPVGKIIFVLSISISLGIIIGHFV